MLCLHYFFFHPSFVPWCPVKCPGDAQDPLSQLDSDDDMDDEDEILAMQLPEGCRLQEHPSTVLDRALIKRYVFVRRGMGWFLGRISRAAAPQTRHLYDYRVVLSFDQSTISVQLPLNAYNPQENAEPGAWVLLEPTDSSNEMGGESRSDAGPRTSGRTRTPNVRNFDQPG